MQTISIIGLGKLGASMAAAIASRGFHVIGVDVNRESVERLNAGEAPVQETNLRETIRANRERLRATLSHDEAIQSSELSFVIVPTPSDERGAFILQYAAWAFREIGRALAKKTAYHNVVLTSTVLPGSTRYGLLPILEQESGKSCGKDFGLCYSPEFIALGSVIRDFLHPDFTLVGEFDERAGGQLDALYNGVLPDNPPCKRMGLENAELTKIAINSYVTMKVTYANLLAELCQRIPGGDVDVVTDALGADRRIGRHYLKGGLGYGGPCFPRDNLALSFLANQLGVQANLATVTDQINRALPHQVVESLRTMIKPGETVAVLGLAYKPHSHVTDESQGVMVAKALSKGGVRVVAYDPLGSESAVHELHGHAVVLASVEECLRQANGVIVATPDPQFQKLTANDFGKSGAPVFVVDCWRILEDKLQDQPGIRYLPLGRSTEDSANAARLESIWAGH